MSSVVNVVALVGSPTGSATSRTSLLVRHLLDALQQRVQARVEWVELAPIARSLGQALSRDEAAPAVEQALQTIEAADLLVVAAPVYRGSYPGLFKHLVDFIGLEALVDTPVLLAATGGSERHALVIDHQLRPLFSFLQAHTLPIGVYATPADFDGELINSTALQARIALAAERAGGHLAAQGVALPVALRRIA
ncbi:FMN reductase [Stenotrophomonas sp. ZAC14D2_NAIMI4_6]|uniref:FMN reductase n=1 Tax=Stenotrophomonas sp. ZAC14D2_NAIMI4_6 TaxID=2072406 RepID=UPI000D53D87B|nr:FMN reductase [Stenotrophomonas sp. ZAC14D2_NAIMI4_6]AWH21270.1 FMN reductase [Stenotrophomonas sp. ZAC14D2_NAIMI4_6]